MPTTLKPHYVALDLEMNQPSGRIIQIGAIIGNVADGSCVARFSCLVNPQEVLEPRISELCGISPEELANAGTLPQAYDALRDWLLPYAETRQLNALTWGGGDTATLRGALELEDERWLFGRRWVDVKTVYVAWQNACGFDGKGGLANSLRKVGLAFQGRKHNATDDAWNTFRMYVALLSRFAVPKSAPPLDESIAKALAVGTEPV